MAKRKRLTPARMDPVGATGPLGAPEVKSALPRNPLGVRPPIADVAQDAAATAAFSQVAAELHSARTQERLIQTLPLAAIVADYLVRDRALIDPEELQVLTDSLRARGQQTAIEVTDLGDGTYGLISGFRRLAALRALAVSESETDTVLAIVRHPADAAAAYQAMVEENEIRVGLSFYERGRIVARAVDQGVFRSDRAALQDLFAAVPRARRSKIGSFVTVVRSLDDVLRHPTALTEKQGLTLAKALEDDPTLAVRLTALLAATDPADPAAEAAAIAAALAPQEAAPPPALPAVPAAAPQADRAAAETLQDGLDWVQAADGRITLRGARLRDPAFVARLKQALTGLN